MVVAKTGSENENGKRWNENWKKKLWDELSELKKKAKI